MVKAPGDSKWMSEDGEQADSGDGEPFTLPFVVGIQLTSSLLTGVPWELDLPTTSEGPQLLHP